MNIEHLSGYAVSEKNTKGRSFPVPPRKYRDDFDRDRDRIIHSTAFRRLEGKTQVFTPGLNDHYRTRLTHSIEVAQIGRTIARYLGVNESLTEAICLAHDLGHSPFGHAGETVLNDIMADHGGFEHNAQTLRIVDIIEDPYPGIQGLNLLYETRLGFARHESAYDKVSVGGFPERVCSIEGQIASIADRIAYNCHDLEDGLRSSADCVIDLPELWNLDIVKQAGNDIDADKIQKRYVRNIRIPKAIINALVIDVIETTKANIEARNIKTLDDVYNNPVVVGLSGRSEKSLAELEGFLLNNMYFSEYLKQVAKNVRIWLGDIMDKYISNPDRMPEYYRGFIAQWGLERAVCDYVSGMTDRFAMKTIG